jgi:hypothetical protein
MANHNEQQCQPWEVSMSDGLRIVGPPPFLPRYTRGSKESAAGAYLENLVKLMPGEVLTFYPAEKLLKLSDPWPDYRVWPIVCLIVLIILRAKATARAKSWKPQILPFVVSIGTFVLWVYFTNDHFLYWKPDGAAKVLLTYAALLWPILWSGLVPGDPEPPPRG